MDALKPCPFCGEQPEIYDIGNEHTKTRATEIKCRKCNVVMRVGAIRHSLDWTRKVIADQWNRRAIVAAALSELLFTPCQGWMLPPRVAPPSPPVVPVVQQQWAR